MYKQLGRTAGETERPEHTVNIHAEVKTATLYTDSLMTLDFLKISGIHITLVENIRQQLTEMKKMDWHIQFC